MDDSIKAFAYMMFNDQSDMTECHQCPYYDADNWSMECLGCPIVMKYAKEEKSWTS